jgi:hypothetical protein
MTSGGHEIGYVPEEDAADLAPLLDTDHPYTARVKKVLSGSTHDIPVIIADVFQPGTSIPSVVLPSAATPTTAKRTRSFKPAIYLAAAAVLVIAVLSRCGG